MLYKIIKDEIFSLPFFSEIYLKTHFYDEGYDKAKYMQYTSIQK